MSKKAAFAKFYDEGSDALEDAQKARADGQTDEAILKLTTILNPEGRLGWKKESVEQAYGSLKHHACTELARCYRDKKDFQRAEEYLALAENRHPYYSWCGTCQKYYDKELAELKDEFAKRKKL